jgi:hypothetical protein
VNWTLNQIWGLFEEKILFVTMDFLAATAPEGSPAGARLP